MQFNSFLFLLAFLPAVTLLYHLTAPRSARAGKWVLILAGLVFYGWAGIRELGLLMLSVGFNYLAARLIRRRAPFPLFFPVAVNTLLLLYYKYANFAIENWNVWFHRDVALLELALPLGISFFTFQQIAYLVSVQRGELEQVSLTDYLAYILYFPKLLMGPLAEPTDFIGQLNDPALRRFDWDNLASGLKIFSLGLGKKLLLADVFAQGVSWGFEHVGDATAMDWILLTLMYTLQIYFDFSGYSDMAVGASLMLNIRLPINFDSPYQALSIRDFWKRWHISLTRFLTKYIYIPLGGSRRGLFFTCLNTMIVFFISGLWHGANWTFLLWGLLHGGLSVAERLTERYTRDVFQPLRWLVTFALINVLWLLFRAESISQWAEILRTMVKLQDTSVSVELLEAMSRVDLEALTKAVPILSRLTSAIRGFWVLMYYLAAGLICLLPRNNYATLQRRGRAEMIFAALVFCVSFLCISRESTFVYFNF